MKTIKMRIQKHSRPLVIFLAIVVAILTSVVVANATQTITTPNAAIVSYNLAANTSSSVITPASNKPVLLMGCCTTNGGVGQVSLHRFLGSQIDWAGFESPWSGAAAMTVGISNQTGTHIVYIDTSHVVDIKTASIDTILIHNAAGATWAGNVTLIW